MRSYLLLFLVVAFLSLESSTAGWFGRKEDSVAVFQKDASRAWQSGKEASKQKLSETKQSMQETSKATQKSIQEASKSAKKKGAQAAEEGKGLFGDIKTRVGRLFGGKSS